MRRTTLPFAAAMLLAATLTGCGQNQQQSGQSQEEATETALTANLSQFTMGSASGNPTIFLSLVKATETDSSMVYLAKSLSQEDTVALQLEVKKDIAAGVFADGTVDDDKAFTEGTLKFSTVGANSDAFVHALSVAYKQPVSEGMVSSRLEPTVFSSNKTTVDLSSNGTYAFKLSFDNPAGQDAEAFVELNLYNRTVKFWAKDTAQYAGILSAFTGK